MAWVMHGFLAAMTVVGQTSPQSYQTEDVKLLNNFLLGATMSLSFVAAVIFARFYRRTHDRLFLFFAGAFAILGVNRIFFQIIGATDEARTWLYVVRLISFCLILYAIIDKNRRGASR